MEIQKIYTDTSVLGGVFDDEFSKPSKAFFEQLKMGLFEVLISAVVLGEIEFAPQKVKDFFESTLPYVNVVDISEEALKLRNAYLDAKILPTKFSDDALHVALASVSECRIIVSWNFKHIVHFKKIPLYNAVNILNGYNQISIFSPLEVIKYE